MKNKKTFVIILVLSVALLVIAGVLYQQLAPSVESDQLVTQGGSQQENTDSTLDPTEETEKDYMPAPDFTVYTLEGEKVRLSDFKGKPVVLNFWASWCGPCRSEMGDFNEVSQQMQDSVVFMMVNATDGQRETVETASALIKEEKYTFPVFYDRDLEASAAYQVNSLPSTYFINAEGEIVARANGAINRGLLKKGIDMILPK